MDRYSEVESKLYFFSRDLELGDISGSSQYNTSLGGSTPYNTSLGGSTPYNTSLGAGAYTPDIFKHWGVVVELIQNGRCYSTVLCEANDEDGELRASIREIPYRQVLMAHKGAKMELQRTIAEDVLPILNQFKEEFNRKRKAYNVIFHNCQKFANSLLSYVVDATSAKQPYLYSGARQYGNGSQGLFGSQPTSVSSGQLSTAGWSAGRATAEDAVVGAAVVVGVGAILAAGLGIAGLLSGKDEKDKDKYGQN